MIGTAMLGRKTTCNCGEVLYKGSMYPYFSNGAFRGRINMKFICHKCFIKEVGMMCYELGITLQKVLQMEANSK